MLSARIAEPDHVRQRRRGSSTYPRPDCGRFAAPYDGTTESGGELQRKISHELRTPLTSIVGYVELLRDDAASPLNDDQKPPPADGR